MKSQQILVALKIASLAIQHSQRKSQSVRPASLAIRPLDDLPADQHPWEIERKERIESEYSNTRGKWTFRSLSVSLNLSLAACNRAVHDALTSGLLRRTLKDDEVVADRQALEEFLIHGLKYVFPPEHSATSRGIPTSIAAPVLSEHINAVYESILIWPDSMGNAYGVGLKPLHPAVTDAVKNDATLYGLLALIDSIRVGRARERNVGINELKKALQWV